MKTTGDGKQTMLVVITEDVHEATWDIVPAYQLASWMEDIGRWHEPYWIKGVYEFERSKTGGSIQPVRYEVLSPRPEQAPYLRTLVLHLDGQDEVRIDFDVTPEDPL